MTTIVGDISEQTHADVHAFAGQLRRLRATCDVHVLGWDADETATVDLVRTDGQRAQLFCEDLPALTATLKLLKDRAGYQTTVAVIAAFYAGRSAQKKADR